MAKKRSVDCDLVIKIQIVLVALIRLAVITASNILERIGFIRTPVSVIASLCVQKAKIERDFLVSYNILTTQINCKEYLCFHRHI